MFVRSEEEEDEVEVVLAAESVDVCFGASVDTSIASTMGFFTKNWRSCNAGPVGAEAPGVGGRDEVAGGEAGVVAVVAGVVCP